MLTDDKLHDHRRLGRELDIFDTDPLIGAGLPCWLPAGAAIRHALEEYVRELERRAGYQHVYSPVLGKRELYERSGHWDHYRDGMYPPMTFGQQAGGSEQLVLRPSLCPHHAVMFAARARSYRDLPLRMAELGGQYRAELSGVVGGLTRVRGMQLNDAHIFCALDQVAAEAAAALGMIGQAHRAMGISPVRYRLSLAGESAKYVGTAQMWADATAMLRAVLSGCGIDYDTEAGEAAFYGPKIDIQVADAAEREASIATVQIDFYQPDRFNLEYVGPDGNRHRPVMLHRSVIGTAERAVAHLIDVHGGAFPPWLAPVQLVALPVSDDERGTAEALVKEAMELGLRAELASDGTLGARIREQKLVPYLAVIGQAEVAAGEIALRLRTGERLQPMSTAEALAKISCQVGRHSPDLWAD